TALNAFAERCQKLSEHRHHLGICGKAHTGLLMKGEFIAERNGDELGAAQLPRDVEHRLEHRVAYGARQRSKKRWRILKTGVTEKARGLDGEAPRLAARQNIHGPVSQKLRIRNHRLRKFSCGIHRSVE